MAITFGTGGLRGIMGTGPDNINAEMIERASAGLAAYLLDTAAPLAREKGVAIAYDTRNDSEAYAHTAAQAIARMGIPVWITGAPTPTPVLSYAVTALGCVAGIVVTASHNPPEYNGYKVYNRHGYQVTPDEAAAISRRIDTRPAYPQAPAAAIGPMPARIDEGFLAAVTGQTLLGDAGAKASLRIVYTSLHGTGLRYVRDALARDGFGQVSILARQADFDGNFPTVKSPNPEDRDALNLAIEEARRTGAHLVLGTDPDCDRVGAAVLHGGEYVLISGNQMGALLMDFIIKRTPKLPGNGAIVKTIVTNDLGADIARKAKLTVYETLTGFKYIGEKMVEFATSGKHAFVFGYEESYGYLVGGYAHDKDAVVASMLIAEMAAFYLDRKKTLVDALHAIFERLEHCYADALDTVPIASLDEVDRTMGRLRAQGQARFAPLGLSEMQDYTAGFAGLPPSDVLKFTFTDGAWLAARPSGTEPKLKVYYAAKGDTLGVAQARINALRAAVKEVTG